MRIKSYKFTLCEHYKAINHQTQKGRHDLFAYIKNSFYIILRNRCDADGERQKMTTTESRMCVHNVFVLSVCASVSVCLFVVLPLETKPTFVNEKWIKIEN